MGGPHVRGWTASGGALPVSFHAYSGNRGGVRVATADMDGDGLPEIIAAPGASGSEVKIFDGRTYAPRHLPRCEHRTPATSDTPPKRS